MHVRQTMIATLLAASLVAAGGALAHGSAKHVMGTATAVEATRLDVETRDGDTVTLEVGEETRFRDKGGAPAKRDELRVGDRVVVDFHGEGDDRVADEIRFAHPGKGEQP